MMPEGSMGKNIVKNLKNCVLKTQIWMMIFVETNHNQKIFGKNN